LKGREQTITQLGLDFLGIEYVSFTTCKFKTNQKSSTESATIAVDGVGGSQLQLLRSKNKSKQLLYMNERAYLRVQNVIAVLYGT
jgi:hypothetical protein